MQVVEDSKFNLVSSSSSSSSVNKYSSGNVGTTSNVGSNQFSLGGGHNQTVLRTEQAPKVQYLGPNCLLIVYNEKEIAVLLDEHFSKSLTGANIENRTTHRSFPPSFWNRHYYRSVRNNVVGSSSAASSSMNSNPGPSGSSFSYYPDPYSSLLRPSGSSIWSQYAVGTSTQSSNSVVGSSRDFSDVYYGGLPDSNRLHHSSDTHSYNQLLGLGRSAASRIQAPPQYSSIRGDWPVFASNSDYPQSTYPFQTGTESVSSHGTSHAETHKDPPFWFPVA